MVITLIGYRGTGKSSVAVPLASRLRLEVVDADSAIEQRAGRTIQQIFTDDGEEGFRRIERDVMAELLNRSGLVLAAGGGAVLDQQTRQLMSTAGPVVWLKASVDSILSRCGADSTTVHRRPKLTAAGGRGEIEQLLKVREPLYRECADVVIVTDGRSIDEIVEEGLEKLRPWLQEGAVG